MSKIEGAELDGIPAIRHQALDPLVVMSWQGKRADYFFRTIANSGQPQSIDWSLSSRVFGQRLEEGYDAGRLFSNLTDQYKTGPYLTLEGLRRMRESGLTPSMRDAAERAERDIAENGADSLCHLGLPTVIQNRLKYLKISTIQGILESDPSRLELGKKGMEILKERLVIHNEQLDVLKAQGLR